MVQPFLAALATLSLLTEMGSEQDRDVLLASGMEAGVQAGYDLLEEIAIALEVE